MSMDLNYYVKKNRIFQHISGAVKHLSELLISETDYHYFEYINEISIRASPKNIFSIKLSALLCLYYKILGAEYKL